MLYFNIPKTVDEAVEKLISELKLSDRVFIARLKREDLYVLQISLGAHIRQEFGLLAGNRNLIHSCRVVSESDTLTADQGVEIILEALWKELRRTHAIRVIGPGKEN